MGFLYIANGTEHSVRVTVFRGRIKRDRLTVWLTADHLPTPPGHRLVVASTVNGIAHSEIMVPVGLRDGGVTIDIRNLIGAMYELYKDADGDTILSIQGFLV